MRRFEESQKNDFARSVKLGEENAECLRQIRLWCKNVEIDEVASGLYAQMTGLPIGSHSIGCRYVGGGWSGMDLRWIFSDFLIQHCAACPHHTPNGDISWGQKIISDYKEETLRREQQAKEQADHIFLLRNDLRLRTKDISAEADPESCEILKFLESVFSEDETERIEASERLKQSAHLAPELFPDTAIELILALAGNGDFSRFLLPVCIELASSRPDTAGSLQKMSLDNIIRDLLPELSASVLDELGNAVEYPLQASFVEKLLLSQNHHRPIGGWPNGEPIYAHTTNILIKCFDAEPESIESIISKQLKNENGYERIQLCGAVKLIQEKRPQLVLNLLEELIRSLELYDDEESGTEAPSGQIVHILQDAFRSSPQTVDELLAKEMLRVRPTVQEDIVRVYRDQFFDRSVGWETRSEYKNRTEISVSENTAIQRLLIWAKDGSLELDIRVAALEALEMACNYATAGVLSHFEALLGFYAVVATAEGPPEPPLKIILLDQPQDPYLDQLNKYNRVQEWGNFKRRLLNCLEEICEARPKEVLESVCACYDEPTAPVGDSFKGCCILLLGKIGKDYLLRPRVLPLIWRGLMDYSSEAAAWIRSIAVSAVLETFRHSSSPPPANLLEVLVIHLKDPKVIVHKAALRAVSSNPSWFDDKHSYEVLNCLAAHLEAYKNDKYQLDDICDAILAISRRNDRLKLIGYRMVESIFPTGERLVDSKIVDKLTFFCKTDEKFAHLVAKNVGTFLGDYGRDRFNYYGHSERSRLFQWLHELSPPAYQRAAEELFASATILAGRDAWESCHFASFFSAFQGFSFEHKVLNAAITAIPDEPRNTFLRSSLSKLALIAEGNAFLAASDVKAAEACFAAGKD